MVIPDIQLALGAFAASSRAIDSAAGIMRKDISTPVYVALTNLSGLDAIASTSPAMLPRNTGTNNDHINPARGAAMTVAARRVLLTFTFVLV
jgi:hypothetical protein